MQQQLLPINEYANEIIESIRNNPVVVVIGETGSGKTTQLPQIVEDAGLALGGRIAVTQPRRVAAVSVARRVAQERNVELGVEVGYSVRFEDCSCSKTRIKYLTDGTLLREALQDPTLSQYSIIILDEAHERSLNTDILFGLLKQLALRGRQLKLVVTSATLDSAKFSSYFDNCPIFNVPGRVYPVEIIHSMEDHVNDYEAAAHDTAMEIHCNTPVDSGDILIFLTGQAEIERVVRALNDAVRSLPEESCGDMLVLPLYAALPPELQSRVFARPPPDNAPKIRRCIVATNIAETSVTVDGVVYVIDPGMVKQKDYNPSSGMESLGVVRISRVQAAQRAGRAGRTRPGQCYRLYTKRTYDEEMPTVTLPEIQRSSLAGTVLYLKSLSGLEIDVLGFDYLDRPDKVSLEDALRQLYVLDAIDAHGKITASGKSMAALPVEPSLARALLAARELGCLQDMLSVVGMLSPEGSIFLGGKSPEQLVRDDAQLSVPAVNIKRDVLRAMMSDGLGDHVLLLRIWQGWKESGHSFEWCKEMGIDVRAMRFAKDVRHQLVRIFNHDYSLGDDDGFDDRYDTNTKRTTNNNNNNNKIKSFKSLRKALTIGFANKLARRMTMHNGYRTVASACSALAQIHPSCAPIFQNDQGLFPEWVVYHELVSFTGRTVYLQGVCPVESSWVSTVLPKLHAVDVAMLSGGETSKQAFLKRERNNNDDDEQNRSGTATGDRRRNDEAAVNEARLRYLARKKVKLSK